MPVLYIYLYLYISAGGLSCTFARIVRPQCLVIMTLTFLDAFQAKKVPAVPAVPPGEDDVGGYIYSLRFRGSLTPPLSIYHMLWITPPLSISYAVDHSSTECNETVDAYIHIYAVKTVLSIRTVHELRSCLTGKLYRPSRVHELPAVGYVLTCLLYTSPSPRDMYKSRMPSSA